MAKIVNYKPPKSSFMSVDKDMSLIAQAMLQNTRLKRLLFEYPGDPVAFNNPLHARNLTEEESNGLLNRNIKIIPKLEIDPEVLSYIIISFDNFTPNGENPQFRDNIISFDIICHFNT